MQNLWHGPPRQWQRHEGPNRPFYPKGSKAGDFGGTEERLMKSSGRQWVVSEADGALRPGGERLLHEEWYTKQRL